MGTKEIAEWLFANPQAWFQLAEYIAEKTGSMRNSLPIPLAIWLATMLRRLMMDSPANSKNGRVLILTAN